MEELLGQVPGVVDILGMQQGNPELTWPIDPGAAGRLGLTVEDVSQQISSAWLGEVATSYLALDRNIPVRVRYPDAVRLDGGRLGQTVVRGSEGKSAPISALASVVPAGGQTVLTRENLRQMALVSGHLEGRDLGSAVDEITAKLRAEKLPVGYTWEVGGQYQAQRQAFRELLLVFAIASALVFVVLVIQFRSFSPAVLILWRRAAVAGGRAGGAHRDRHRPERLVGDGADPAHRPGRQERHRPARLRRAPRREGVSAVDAIYEAAGIRLRPILMTTLCTLFGLLPLALGIGAGAELQRPLALAVIGGLSLSTIITLYLIPALYSGLYRARSARTA